MAVFPGLQGGPLVHVIAAKAVAFGEALRPEFKVYARSVVENAKALAASLEEHGLRIVSGGTDNHLMLVDLTPKEVTGKAAEVGLDRAFLTCNKNAHPVRPAAADQDLGRPPRHPGGHHARVRPGRVPQGRRADRRSARRHAPQRRRRRRASRGERAPPRQRTVRSVSRLSREVRPMTDPNKPQRRRQICSPMRKTEIKAMAKEGAAPSFDQAGAGRRRRSARSPRLLLPVVIAGRSASSPAPASCSTRG